MQQREVILIFGQTGSGKTYHARELARTYPRVLVADAGFGDYAPIPEVADFPALIDSLEKSGAFSGRPFRVSYDFRPEEYSLAFQTALTLRNVLLLLEEADRFTLDDPYYSESIFRGRHFDLSLLLVSLHPRSIPTEIRRQATKIISYRQIFPDDVDWLAEIVGDEAYKLPTLSGPPSAPPNPYLIWTQTEGARIIGAKNTTVLPPGPSPRGLGLPVTNPTPKET